MGCQRCNSKRLFKIDGKSSDRNIVEYDGKVLVNCYVPTDAGLGSDSDCIIITYCLDCGQLQGEFPIHPDIYDEDEEEE
jgi:hypothetical protein